MASPAFVQVGASSFTRPALASRSSVCTAPAPSHATTTMMADKKGWGGLPNPFANKNSASSTDSVAESGFSVPQPGDPGYVEPKAEKFEFEESELPAGPPSKMKAKLAAEEKAKEDAENAEKEAKKGKVDGKGLSAFTKKNLPFASGTKEVEGKKRGLDLLRQDLLKSAPEIAGVGRQDKPAAIMAPSYGEPGYKPQAYETAFASDLGISPFPDDANAVGKVGGLAAVQKAARAAKKGESAKALKAKALKKEVKIPDAEKVFDIPDYLKPLPEDTPRKGLTWKNYSGR